MSTAIDSIYLRLPSWIQNVAISAYGLNQRVVRRGSGLPSEYADVFAGPSLSLQEIKDRQNRRLRQLISHAVAYVPHYSDLVKRLRVSPADVTVDSLVTLFPVLEKTEILPDPKRFHSAAIRKDDLKLFTSGTSGSPMPIRCTREARAINYAYFSKVLNESGVSASDRSVTFAGRVLFSNREQRQFWRKDFVNKTLYCSSYFISPQTIPGYIAAIEDWDPRYIDSYPSSISQIAQYINERGIKHSIRPKFVLTSSETLTLQQREEIETAFNCSVVDQYGCTEMAVMAYSAGKNYRIEPLYSLVEFIQRPGADTYAVVCTGLLNFAMPLVRYRIGDLVLSPSADPDWLFQSATFEAISGREDDSIVTPEGRRVGRIDPVFKGITGISKAQIVQNEPTSLEVLIVRSPKGEFFDEEQLKTNIRNRTSPQMLVTIRMVDDIPLTKAGKFKSVVSRVNQA